MEKDSLELTAKTVDEAIELAILELGAERDEVEVDVISRGRTGILGIGSEPARVRVSLITAGSGAATALGVVNEMLRAMGVDARPTIRSSGAAPDEPAIIDIQGEDAGLIIGQVLDIEAVLRPDGTLLATEVSERESEDQPVNKIILEGALPGWMAKETGL